MSNNNEPTIVEKISGNPILNIASNLFALATSSYSGGISALVSPFMGILTSELYQKRIADKWLEISKDLEAQQEKLNNLTDAQFKLINEISCTVLSTIHEEKLAYLRNAINNTLDEGKILDHESVLISRIIRDISVDEIKFLLDPTFNGQEYEEIYIGTTVESDHIENNALLLSENSNSASAVWGLNNLGLFLSITGFGSTGNIYQYIPIAEKVRSLLREKPDK